MRKDREKQILIHYLRERSIPVIAYAVITLLFLAVAALYGYDNSVMNMSYAAVIVFFLAVCVGIPDYLHYRKKCHRLYDALARRGESDYDLPEPGGLAERLYYEIVCEAEKEERKLISELDGKKRDMADYYTMWIHQIKTPIAALRLLLQREADAREAENRKQSAEELFKIEQYAEMALHYARLDSMSSDLMFQEYDISVIIKQAVRKYSLLFIGSGLSFTMEDFACKAVTDEKWLMFAVEQILSNALKYTPEGKICIYGADKYGNRQEGNVRYIVMEDTGIGIRDSDLPRIFERGFTGYNGRMGKKSTGIGLYLCKEILDKLSHSIRVESAVSKGTKVILGFRQDM